MDENVYRRIKYEWPRLTIDVLLGKTLAAIDVSREENMIVFTESNGQQWLMYHSQECCETVTIEDVAGYWNDLIGSPLLMAEEVTKRGGSEDNSETWTFYKFATENGYVTLRWYGESNGYYSESVDFARLVPTTGPKS
jgi:hypothetical protein